MKNGKLKVKNERLRASNPKGITLIALVITIIVLLILAGITINLTIGQDGIIKRAEEAGRNYVEAAEGEKNQLAQFTELTDKLITSTTQGIDMEVLNLKAGDYIKYDTGVSTVGENGVIMCRVLYPASSEYGLQIISDKNVRNVTLGVQGDYAASTVAYNNAIEDLNDYAEDYINENYAYDARCVGSAPTVSNGMFINKNKVKFEGTTAYVVPSETNYETPQFENAKYINSYGTDINYKTDKTQMEEKGLWTTGEDYWLASRCVYSYSSRCDFYVRSMNASGSASCNLCVVNSSDNAYGNAYGIGVRPCISLKANVIKITGGTGEDADNAYIIGL
mgnify:CR=1 FL=1